MVCSIEAVDEGDVFSGVEDEGGDVSSVVGINSTDDGALVRTPIDFDFLKPLLTPTPACSSKLGGGSKGVGGGGLGSFRYASSMTCVPGVSGGGDNRFDLASVVDVGEGGGRFSFSGGNAMSDGFLLSNVLEDPGNGGSHGLRVGFKVGVAGERRGDACDEEDSCSSDSPSTFGIEDLRWALGSKNGGGIRWSWTVMIGRKMRMRLVESSRNIVSRWRREGLGQEEVCRRFRVEKCWYSNVSYSEIMDID